jgi:hypothetical protein
MPAFGFCERLEPWQIPSRDGLQGRTQLRWGDHEASAWPFLQSALAARDAQVIATDLKAPHEAERQASMRFAWPIPC